MGSGCLLLIFLNTCFSVVFFILFFIVEGFEGWFFVFIFIFDGFLRVGNLEFKSEFYFRIY